MLENTQYTTAEIAAVLKLYSEIKQGKKPDYDEKLHTMMRSTLVNNQFYINSIDNISFIRYRGWYIATREPYFNTNRREVYDEVAEEDYQLYRAVIDAANIQVADILRTIIYDGQPIEILVQCCLIELGYKLGIIPKRSSELTRAWSIAEVAEELQRNGTFNI